MINKKSRTRGPAELFDQRSSCFRENRVGLLFRGGKSFSHGVPVNHVEKRRDVIGPAILVIQVVGVFPNVEAEDWGAAFHERAVLIGGAFDNQFAAIDAQPSPTASKPGCRRIGEFFFEAVETAEFRVDCRRPNRRLDCRRRWGS